MRHRAAVVVPYEQQNKYVVKNTMGQFIFLAVEESDLLQRCCCGMRRAFEMKVLDYRNVEVLRFIRPLRCECTICFCCLQVCAVLILNLGISDSGWCASLMAYRNQ
ncbi:hypothetical protein HPB48_011135 [Haemaphysalis longicornis]|uniref:Phospholipid scramblase n=1 Tax=Haemaphysalis longicornis TaxID=44386 RepID=A0A9J6GHZ9_HAELO|nr:hypothetical protein HPB48_011135 [Haemaphysalis longicornis]